jgi:hypothetical protein
MVNNCQLTLLGISKRNIKGKFTKKLIFIESNEKKLVRKSNGRFTKKIIEGILIL